MKWNNTRSSLVEKHLQWHHWSTLYYSDVQYCELYIGNIV